MTVAAVRRRGPSHRTDTRRLDDGDPHQRQEEGGEPVDREGQARRQGCRPAGQRNEDEAAEIPRRDLQAGQRIAIVAGEIVADQRGLRRHDQRHCDPECETAREDRGQVWQDKPCAARDHEQHDAGEQHHAAANPIRGETCERREQRDAERWRRHQQPREQRGIRVIGEQALDARQRRADRRVRHRGERCRQQERDGAWLLPDWHFLC